MPTLTKFQISNSNFQKLAGRGFTLIRNLYARNYHMSAKRDGFTLIELLVVIAILGILAGIGMSAIKGAQASARDAQRKSDIADIRSALEIYRADCGDYPAATTMQGYIQNNSALVGTGTGNCLSSNTYMSRVPNDPQTRANARYAYSYDPTTKKYAICAYLEHPGSTGAQTCSPNSSGSLSDTCGSKTCYYKLTSP